MSGDLDAKRTRKMLTLKEASRLYDGRISPRVLRDMIHTGELQARRPRHIYFLNYDHIVAVCGEPFYAVDGSAFPPTEPKSGPSSATI